MPSQPIRFAIISPGVIADFHAQAIRAAKEAELVAVFARDNIKGKSFAKKYGIESFYDWDTFLKSDAFEAVTGKEVGRALDEALAEGLDLGLGEDGATHGELVYLVKFTLSSKKEARGRPPAAPLQALSSKQARCAPFLPLTLPARQLRRSGKVHVSV